MHLDNAGNLDAASQRVLRQLAGDLADVPLLLVCTGSTDPGSGPDAAETGWAAARDLTVDLRVTVGPLTDEEIGRLAQVQLGADVIAEPLKAQLVTRARGNPGMLLEYLRAMLEDGAIRPSWGTWLLDEAALARLDLSADVADLMIRRLDGLSEPAREIMTAAAAIPLPFSLNLLAAICEVDFESAADALQQAISQGTVANRPGGSYVFLHDLLTRALLSGLTGEERRQLHLRVAHALGMTGLTGSAISYALAHEYELGDPGYTTPGMFTACYRAGRLALAEDAAPEAAHFLELARHTADRTGVPLDSAFEHICGLVAMRQGRYDEARGYFGAAIDGEPDPVRRAEILSLVAQTYRGEYRAAECVSTVQLALAELGEALPASRRELLRSTLRLFRAGLKVGRSKPGQLFGTAEGEEQRRFRIQVHLQRLGAAGANMGLDGPLAVAFLLRSLYPANRVGTSPETIRLRADLGVLANAVGWRWRARRLLRSARVLADMSGDPGLAAHVARARAMSEDQGRGLRARSGSATISMLQSYGRWLDPDEYLASVATLGSMQVLRGYAREALVWCDRGAARVAAGARVLGTPYAMVRVLAGSALGRVSEASAQLGAMREYVETTGTPEQQLHMLVASEHAALEQGELGATFDDAVAERASLPLPLRPGRFWAPYSVLWVYQVFGRLAQAREATGDARAERLEQARAALRLLGRASGAPVLRAYHLCAQASYQQLTGKPGRALRRLVRAERLAHGLDLPSLTAEIATVRARALAALGEGAESRRQAKNAYLLATDYGWQPRGRALRLEFEVSMLASAMDQSHTSLMSSSVGGPYQRRLIALQEVSMAAATVLDPRELARVALDEIIRILGAERALLFLTDDDTDELHPHLGRDAAGHDLDELTGYGSTLVERVHQTREPLVITGSEQGAALGSESVVVHGLRSIMVAPLQLKGRLLGVVYLDNRVAKGVFTVGDVDILSAITHLIAASLETARAAQLELAVHTAQQQRDLADTMRAAIADVGATLDPTEVITRLAGTLKRVLDSDLAFLLRPGTDGWTGAPIEEPVEEEAVGCQVGPVDKPDPVDVSNPAVAALVATSTGTVHELPRPLAGAMSGVRGWLAIPLAARDERVGVLVIASCTGGSYDEAQAKIAAALAGQAMIAYDNALLFSRVEQLATIDSLSGLNNRRHFFELATRDVEVAVRQRRPLATAMLDIDHFKKINDTYGHAVGDEVIREVASRISHNLRSFDIVGRYGGEEFALVLPEVGDEITTIAERLRAAVAGTPVQTAGGPVPVTVSIGVARSQGSDDLDCMLVRADEALYKAKAGGRNRVQHA
ncbi:MAG: hypothetical protein AUI14_04795 [Actinobacteria bacterium 13_2_20CM_2_71_6]|nr:MAG: hypothetical protein AUI14_04795 [Actinobacteria bacterium 13_2_20CM_2_71_6]